MTEKPYEVVHLDELDPEAKDHAARDEDFDAIRDRPDFPS